MGEAILLLDDGRSFKRKQLGAEGVTVGKVCFNRNDWISEDSNGPILLLADRDYDSTAHWKLRCKPE